MAPVSFWHSTARSLASLSNTAFPLCRYVRTPVHFIFSSSAVSDFIGSMLLPVTFTPRIKAM